MLEAARNSRSAEMKRKASSVYFLPRRCATYGRTTTALELGFGAVELDVAGDTRSPMGGLLHAQVSRPEEEGWSASVFGWVCFQGV